MLESEIEKYLVKRVADIGGIAYKFTSPSNRGVFDRLVVMPNRCMWFVELKSAKGKLSPLQEKFERDVLSRGHSTMVLHSKAAVDMFIALLKLEQVEAL